MKKEKKKENYAGQSLKSAIYYAMTQINNKKSSHIL